MNNNEDVQDYQNKRHQSGQPSVDSPKNEKNIFSRNRQANNIAHKSNGILGTYSRIVPKKPTHDFQRLYAENIRLKEHIQLLEENSKKVKTRLIMMQKQKQQLIGHINKQDKGYTGIRQKRGSMKVVVNRVDEKIKRANLDQNRRILHNYKDQICKLQIENARLKKTIKYTQIQEMEIQNHYLQLEMVRIKEYAHQVVNSADYEQYEKQIGALQKQLIGQKEHSKTYYMQIKKKDEEIEGVKSQMKALVMKKTEMQRKFSRDLINAKEEAQRGKSKEKLIGVLNGKKESAKQSRSQKEPQVNGMSYKQNYEKQKDKVIFLEKQLEQKQVEMKKLSQRIKVLQSAANTEGHFIKQNPNVQSNNFTKSQLKPNQSTQINKSQTSSKKPKHNNLQSNHEDQSEQIYTDDYEQSENLKGDNRSNNMDHHNVINIDQESIKDIKRQQKEQEQQELYNESFDQIDEKDQNKAGSKNEQSQEQVLFQKEPKPQKKQTKNKKQSIPQQDKQEYSLGKVVKILQQTIKYRLIAQRYTYTEFHRDIIESQETEFTAEQLIEMLSSEPFFLSQQHLSTIITDLFEKQELQPEDIIETNAFLQKMKKFIICIEIPEEADEQQNLKQIQKKLNQTDILSKLKQQSKGQQISKKGFMKVLKQFGKLNDQQVQQCLAEVSIMSEDISRINYKEFMKKIKSL